MRKALEQTGRKPATSAPTSTRAENANTEPAGAAISDPGNPPDPNQEGSPSRLSVKQRLAIENLVRGHSRTAVARMVGVDRTTVQRWLTDPDFLAEIHQQERAFLDAAAARPRLLVNAAFDQMEALLQSAPPRVRFDAAMALIKLAAVAPQRIGSTDPQEIRNAQEQAERGRKRDQENDRRDQEREKLRAAEEERQLVRQQDAEERAAELDRRSHESHSQLMNRR